LLNVLIPVGITAFGVWLEHQWAKGKVADLQEQVNIRVQNIQGQVVTVSKRTAKVEQRVESGAGANVVGSNNTTSVNNVDQADRPVFAAESPEGKLIRARIDSGDTLLSEARNCDGVSEAKVQELATRVNAWAGETGTVLNGFSPAASQRFRVGVPSNFPLSWRGCTETASALINNLTILVDNLRLMLK